MILEDILNRTVSQVSDKTAIIYGERRITYQELYQRTNRLANALLNLGIRKETRVAVMEKNCPEFIELYFAVAKTGGIVVPISFRLKGKELFYVLNNSKAQVLFFGAEFSSVVDSVRPELPELKTYICIGKSQSDATPYEELLNKASSSAPGVGNNENDVIILMYTSGTTGVPKGTLLTHRNVLHVMINQLITLGQTRDDVCLNCLTFFHVAIIFSLVIIMTGGINVIQREFSPEEVLRLIEGEKVTIVVAVPSELSFILTYPEKHLYNLKSLKSIYYGAMPITTKLLRESLQFFQCDFYQVYGSTEAGFMSCLGPKDHLLEGPLEGRKRLQSAGKAVVFCELKVVGEHDQEVSVGEVGEIVVRSNSVMKGYYGLRKETEIALRNKWFHTGDLARVDEDGYVYIVDRKSDMIISGGENIYPPEIEEIICSHPSVQMAAVIGVPDSQWGEAVKAVLVLKEGAKATEDEIIKFSGDKLAGFKKPKAVEFVDSLPLNPAGKVLKKVLREKDWEGYDRRVH